MNPDLRRRLLDVARGSDGHWVATPQAAEARRLLTRMDPQLFAVMYMSRHLRGPETGDKLSLSPFHRDFYDSAKQWARTDLGPAELREAWVAPRGSGKSTMLFLICPIWALAHGHRRFVAAFADSGPQAEQHLMSLKRELDVNELLRYDFPDLCTPARRPGGVTVADSRSLMLTASGAVFQAKGIDASTLGTKVGNQRPDLILFDDIEPSGSNYSPYQKEKRQATIIEAVFAMNLNAAVQFAGTTTMYGSVMHDIVRQVTDPVDAPQWVQDEHIRTRYYPAILTADDGAEASLWPERWSLEFLQSIRHTRSFAMNYQNRPMSLDGHFWSPEDFRYDVPAGVTRRILSIDPAGTSRDTSDYTGLAVVGYSPVEKRCVVLYAAQVRLPPARLREKCLTLLSRYEVHGALVETNSGGDAWPAVLDLPVKTVTLHQTEPKQVRAAQVLDYYQSGWVAHDGPQRAFEDQAVAFPNGAHDDVVDAVGSGVHLFLKGRRAPTRNREAVSAYA